jgi:glycosyltransferase involved in cell wall biosynthesis
VAIKNICICVIEAPFVKGGAEIQMDTLAQEMKNRGYNVAKVALPFVWTPVRDILKNCLIWRWIDLERCTDVPIDLVICSKFPSYAVRHPRKITWLIHQFRQAYELHGTEHSQFLNTPEDQSVRKSIIEFDTRMLSESKAIFTESKNVANRLKHYNGLDGKPLYHPPIHWDKLYHQEYGNYILSVGRLVPLKRVDMLLEGLAAAGGSMQAVIVGEGPERERLEAVAEKLNLKNRVKFIGASWGQDLIDLYAGARGVYYAPYDEDYGLVVPEAFRSRKPVITTTDGGGTLEFVVDGQTGFVTEPNGAAIGSAIRKMEDAHLCAILGDAGYEFVKFINWDYVINNLVETA